MSLDMTYFNEMEAKIPHGKVRTRFAPSPTGYMHVGNLRTALYTWLIARNAGGTFILRIEDTDQGRLIEGATDVIYRTLAECGLDHDEGPDVGGPVAPYIQSERRDTYGKYAELLVERGGAYYCFCEKTESAEDSGEFDRADDPCRDLPLEEAKARVAAGEPYVVRQRIPKEGTTTFHDAIFGDITVENKTLDDQVLLKRDGLPTYNFANVIDDHLMGITHVVRGSEYLSSAPKYNLLYEAFGWEVPTYVHCSPVMRDSQHKMSKRHGDPSYEDLKAQGFLTPAILNYVALLGWSPRGERAEQEFFTMSELAEAFDIAGISKSPAIFDIEKLTYFNANYIRNMASEDFAKAAEPFIRQSVKNEAYSASEIAALLQARCEKLTDIPEKVDFFDALPDYDLAFYTNKKSKTDAAVSLEMLQKVLPKLEALNDWSTDGIHDMLIAFAEELGVKNATLMWPLRIACAGKLVTPGGAVEICKILGKDETISPREARHRKARRMNELRLLPPAHAFRGVAERLRRGGAPRRHCRTAPCAHRLCRRVVLSTADRPRHGRARAGDRQRRPQLRHRDAGHGGRYFCQQPHRRILGDPLGSCPLCLSCGLPARLQLLPDRRAGRVLCTQWLKPWRLPRRHSPPRHL